MELFRRREKNKLTNDIRTNENFIKRSQETISRLIISSSDPFVLNQIEKLKNAIEEKTLAIENMKKELIDVETGASDEKINSQYKEQNKKQEKNIKDKLTEKTNEKKS